MPCLFSFFEGSLKIFNFGARNIENDSSYYIQIDLQIQFNTKSVLILKYQVFLNNESAIKLYIENISNSAAVNLKQFSILFSVDTRHKS